MPQLFVKTIELAQVADLDDPAAASLHLHVCKDGPSPRWWLGFEDPAPGGGNTLQLTPLDESALSSDEQREYQRLTLKLQGEHFDADACERRPLPVKVPVEPVEPVGGEEIKR